VPNGDEGVVRTRPFRLPGGKLTVNARAGRGEVRVRLLDPEGKPLPALGEADARPVRGDVLAGEVRWPRPLARLRGAAVRLEFCVRRGALFGFEFHA
jgi:hypothetical protein